MESEGCNTELERIIEAIKSSDVVEIRIQLINELGDLDISKESEKALVFETLSLAFWEDFTCLDVTQCMLNKAILEVLMKYLDSIVSSFCESYLALGTKASIWCKKHLKMTVMSSEESQEEEHSILFFQLLVDMLKFSVTSLSALAQHASSDNMKPNYHIENFILEQLSLIKDLLPELKRIQSVGSEVSKLAQAVIESVIKLCQGYWQSIRLDLLGENPDGQRNSMLFEGANGGFFIVNIAKCTIKMLCELGTFAATEGGSLVGILNVSWKGVVTLLQLGKGALEARVNVADIVLSLISQANEALRSAAEIWSLPPKEPVTLTEARRAFIPVKFFLINAVKLSTLYPFQACLVHREILLSLLMISNFRISLYEDINLKIASEVSQELLEQTSMTLLYSVLNSSEVKLEMKFKILDSLFPEENCYEAVHEGSCANDWTIVKDKIFSLSCEDISKARTLALGRVLLFISLLRCSCDVNKDVRLGIARKLDWLFNVIVFDEVYARILSMQIPVNNGAKKLTDLVWEPMYTCLLQSLKTFVVVASSGICWEHLRSFLLVNIFHPHFLCWEIVSEIWCFMVRFSDEEVVNGIVDGLCSCLKLLASADSIFVADSGLRKVARSICNLVTNGRRTLADRVCSYVINEECSDLSSVMLISLLIEGFSMSLLTDNLKGVARLNISYNYNTYIENFNSKALGTQCSGFLESPVFALSASLLSFQDIKDDINQKTLHLLLSHLQICTNVVNDAERVNCLKLLGLLLEIVSHVKHLYALDEINEVILTLKDLLIAKSAASDAPFYHCKVGLSLFLAGLAHMEIEERDGCPTCSAVWELYHVLLRERHWAFVHLAVTAFGYFAERTSCNQLWRFVPQNAALSYDLLHGKEANEERFMAEFKTFLEKEMALSIIPTNDQLVMLIRDALYLKEAIRKIQNLEMEPEVCERMEIDSDKQPNKKRKIPDEISMGVELLQSGLKIIGDGLSEWQKTQANCSELHDKFLAQISCLKDAINQLASLSGTG